MTLATPTLGAFYFCRLALAMTHLHTKFQVSSFNRSGDRLVGGGANFIRRSSDPGHAHFGGISLFRLVLAMTQLHTKYEVSSCNHSGDKRGSQILKESHVTRATLLLEGILFFVG